jgi:hypothetical protein
MLGMSRSSSTPMTTTGTSSVSSVAVASMPWVFTQAQPLRTSEFIAEAKRRGYDLHEYDLRELYKHQLLIPFVYVSSRQAGPIPPPVASEPDIHSTRQTELRYARDHGRLVDLAAEPFRPRLRFEGKAGDSQWWWNGLLYSRFQLLVLPELDELLHHRRPRRRSGRLVRWLPKPHASLVDTASRFRCMAVVLAALEARYLPKLDPEWLHLVNADETAWRQYAGGFDPVAISQQLAYPAAQVREDAEWLLSLADRSDPVGHGWSRLIRRAPRKAWKELKDAALVAMDYREAAELLLLFYEDLANRGTAASLPVLPPPAGRMHHPLDERLSNRDKTLDQNLMELGVSPHPRVVLVIEGDTEQIHIPLVWKALDYPDAPELMRVLKLGGVDRDLEKVAAVTAAPLVGGEISGPGGGWWLIKPPTCLFIAVDPEGRYFAPDRVDGTRNRLIQEINAVLAVQGVTNANQSEIGELIKIRTWSASCYEFAHFSDEELADGIMAVHTTINGLTRDELIERLSVERKRVKDIKAVWSQWS